MSGRGSASGARGGGGRGRGRGRGPTGKRIIGGMEVTWEDDNDLQVDSAPQELQPPIVIPDAQPLTIEEQEWVKNYRDFRTKCRQGPLYTTLDPSMFLSATPRSKNANVDPFEDMPSYEKKYTPPSYTLPRFKDMNLDLRKFPRELWSTIDPSLASKDKSKKKQAATTVSLKRKRDAEEEEEAEEQKEADENVDEEDLKEDDEDAVSRSDPEDDFSDDDSEMGGDYNAEQYFDGGDEDEADVDEGGEEGGFD